MQCTLPRPLYFLASRLGSNHLLLVSMRAAFGPPSKRWPSNRARLCEAAKFAPASELSRNKLRVPMARGGEMVRPVDEGLDETASRARALPFHKGHLSA